MADNHNCGLTKSNLAVLKSSMYADMTVHCNSAEFKLHRAIVCPRSKFFAAACDGQFQEARDYTIVLVEDDLPTVHRMVNYLYTLDYDDDGLPASAQHYMVDGTKPTTSQKETTAPTPRLDELWRHNKKMMNNVVVYAIAQKYDIEELKEFATAKFRDLLFLEEPNDAFPEIVGTVFETTLSTDPRLRDVVVEYCTGHSTKIIADDRLCNILKDYSELGLSVLREVDQYANRKQDQKRRLREQLVTLKEELAQMVKKASNVEKMRQINPSVTAILQELKTTYNKLKIESDESAGSEEDEEGDENE